MRPSDVRMNWSGVLSSTYVAISGDASVMSAMTLNRMIAARLSLSARNRLIELDKKLRSGRELTGPVTATRPATTAPGSCRSTADGEGCVGALTSTELAGRRGRS